MGLTVLQSVTYRNCIFYRLAANENFKCQFVIICDTIFIATINHPTPNLVHQGGLAHCLGHVGPSPRNQCLREKQQLQHEMSLSLVLMLLVSSP